MAKILIIEDDAAIAAIEKDYLELSGYEVNVCADGVSGLTAALEQPFDPLLLDLMLPGMDGFAVCRRAFVRAVGDGENGAPSGGMAQRLQDPRFGGRVQIGGDLIQREHGGVCRRGACDGQKLPLALGEHAVRTHRGVSLRQRPDGGARPAHQRHLLALPYGHGEVVENGSFAVAEGHMG